MTNFEWAFYKRHTVLTHHNNEIAEKDAEIAALRKHIESLERSRSMLRQDIDEADKALAEKDAEIAALEWTHGLAVGIIKVMMYREIELCTELDAQIFAHNCSLAKLRAAESEAKEMLAAHKEEVDALKKEIRALQSSNDLPTKDNTKAGSNACPTCKKKVSDSSD